ncbi:MAG: 4-alpha-glucanotransferase [Cyanobacteria bacterium SIG30]|nr:4-alpha-glucanotransferase [Cyanobacteria bacterium SIG30]
MLGIKAIQSSKVNFGRKLRENEVEGYKRTIDESLRALDKELGIIIHHSSAPSEKEKDTGIGSLYSEASRNLVLPFLNKHNFSSIQVEPETTRKFGDASPYASSNNMANILMQDLEMLTREEFGSLLSKSTFEDIVNYNPNKNTDKANFDYANSSYERAFSEAWDNFKNGNGKQIEKLRKDFSKFKEDKQKYLEGSILYEVLCEENKSDYWKNWNNDFDKHLFSLNDEAKNERIQEIKTKYADKIDYLYFKQMLVSKARAKSIEEYAKQGINTIGDAPVAFSDADVWSHPNIFMKDYYMGCPPDPFSATGQAWGFAVLNPDKLFKENGKLDEGGKFLFEKYQQLFEDNKGGVRIDHVLGLIDPFVYKTTPVGHDAGRLFSTRNNHELSRFYKNSPKDLEDIIKKIVIPAAESVGLSKENIICEDLGIMPDRARIAFNTLGLRGISITQYVRNSEVAKDNIIMPGSHDSPTIIGYTNDLFNQGDAYNHAAWPLTEDVLPENTEHHIKQRYFDDMRFDYNRPGAKNKFMTSKFAQLFTSPSRSIQIFWPDVLGIDKRYNTPGTNGNANWTLRMNENFEDTYHRNLENGIGLNLPEVLEIAMKQKGEAFANKHQGLINELGKYKSILKERE